MHPLVSSMAPCLTEAPDKSDADRNIPGTSTYLSYTDHVPWFVKASRIVYASIKLYEASISLRYYLVATAIVS